ncbi:MAG TPA: hypothetical protein VGN37_26815 [Actinocatenispora sp.]
MSSGQRCRACQPSVRRAADTSIGTLRPGNADRAAASLLSREHAPGEHYVTPTLVLGPSSGH